MPPRTAFDSLALILMVLVSGAVSAAPVAAQTRPELCRSARRARLGRDWLFVFTWPRTFGFPSSQRLFERTTDRTTAAGRSTLKQV